MNIIAGQKPRLVQTDYIQTSLENSERKERVENIAQAFGNM